MMGKTKRFRNLVGSLKDTASLIKAYAHTLTRCSSTSSIHVVVLRATTHRPSSSPPENRVAAVLSLGHHTRLTACACIVRIMDRLHSTRNAYVALKCLITIHLIITRGSFILKDQLSFCPTNGGHNSLNLSSFRDPSDSESWEISTWVRWYAAVLEQHVIVSRVLGYDHLCSSSNIMNKKDGKAEPVSSLLNSDLLREMNALVGVMEEICRVPNSLHLQRNDLVYEVMRLVGEDYGLIQQEIFVRLGEFEDREGELSFDESVELVMLLKRLEGCKERLKEVLLKKRNDAFWDSISRIQKVVVTKGDMCLSETPDKIETMQKRSTL